MEDVAAIFCLSLIVCLTVAIVLVIVIRKIKAKRVEREEAEQNWELPGQWGAKTTAQKDVLREIREYRDGIGGPTDSEYYSPHEKYFKDLEEMEKKIRENRLDENLLLELAEAVHSYYVSHELWDEAAAVARKFNL